MKDVEKKLKNEIIQVGKRLYEKDLAVAKSGNLSCRLDSDNILITATETSLGYLNQDDVVKFNLVSNESQGSKPPTSELKLHTLIYKNFPSKCIVHCHPPLINGYFAVTSGLKALTFETKFYLGQVPVIEQDTPTVTKPDEVIAALKNNNIVVLKNHGAVAISDSFLDALSLIEALEEAVRTTAVARLFKKDVLDDLDKELKKTLVKDEPAFSMFSRQHIEAIVDLVNKDEFIAQKGKEQGLTVKLAIKLEETDQVFKFTFEEGKIISLDPDCDAPFVISAPSEIWKQVFLGQLDSFVAVTQGKMKLKGQMGQLSKWYVPFTRLFELFKQVKFK